MDNQLMQYVSGDKRPVTKPQREAARQADQIKAEVQLLGLRIDGALAIGAHAMAGLLDLDDHRRELAGEDVARNVLLGEIEAQTIRQVKRLQAGLFDEWGLG